MAALLGVEIQLRVGHPKQRSRRGDWLLGVSSGTRIRIGFLPRGWYGSVVQAPREQLGSTPERAAHTPQPALHNATSKLASLNASVFAPRGLPVLQRSELHRAGASDCVRCTASNTF
eukprot:645610-Pyramimonas_sp.AAC.2